MVGYYAGAALGRVPVNPWISKPPLVNPLISRACTKEPLKFKIVCDSLDVVNPLIEIPNAAPAMLSNHQKVVGHVPTCPTYGNTPVYLFIHLSKRNYLDLVLFLCFRMDA